MNAHTPTIIEIIERGHKQATALRLGPLPAHIGRANHADCVLTDPAVAGLHLRLESHEDTGLNAQVLDTQNGVWLGRKHLQSGDSFTWLPGQRLRLGNTVLLYRRPSDPLPAEVLQHGTAGLRPTLLTGMSLLLLAVLSAWLQWVGADEPGTFIREWPQTLMALLSLAMGWSLLWALLSKLLTGQLSFWRHVRIAASGMVAYLLVQQLMNALGFMFSWPALPRFSEEYMLLILGVCIWAHLKVATHVSRTVLTTVLATLTIAALGVQLGLQWQTQKRLGTGLFMSNVMPPSWRMVPTQGIDGFVDAASGDLQQRLQQRLKDSDEAPPDDFDLD